MPTHSRVRRKRGPALAWTPTQDSYYELARILRSATGATPLYLTQAAILGFEAHLRESSSPLPFGLLSGDVCLDPQTKLEYLVIDTVARARIELAEYDPYAQLAEELRSLALEQAKQRKLAIGWYLGGMADDLTLDSEVTNLHRELFPERWQVALVRGQTSGIERGAFLRFESIWNRWYSIPFFEFVSERTGRKNGERRTALRWANYRADEPARPLDELEETERRPNAAPRSLWGARSFSASLQSFRRAARETPERAPERSPARKRERTPEHTATRAPERSVTVIAPARQPVPTAPVPEPVPVEAPARPAATAPLARSEPLDVAPPTRHVPDPLRVQLAEETVTASAQDSEAPETAGVIEAPESAAVIEATEEPESDVQHVFIDGGLVPVPLAQSFTLKPSTLGTADGVRVSSLFTAALLILMLLALYLIAS